MFRRLYFIGLVCALAAAGRAAPGELPVIRHAQLGFSQQYHNHYWTPLQVDIENPGPDRHVVLVVEPVSRAAGQSITLTKPVWLPANSQRTIFLTVLPEYNENAAPANRDGPAPPIPKVLSLKLTDGGLQVWSQYEILGKVIPEDAALMLVGDARLNSYRIPAEVPVSYGKCAVNRVGASLSHLPARAIDYDGINLLVLGDPGPAGLHAMQRQAIVEWVRAGGTLVFAPSPGDTNGWFESWQALLPVTYDTGDRLATEPQLSRWGAPPVFGWPTDPLSQRLSTPPVLTNGLSLRRMSVHADATVLVGTPNAPLLVTRREGLGSVVAFALDAGDRAFQGWPGATNFNAELFTLALHGIPATDRILEKSTATDAIVSSLAGIKVLGRGPLLLYLVGLVAAMVVVVAAFRFTRAPERGWAVIAVVAVLAGGVVIVLAHRWKGQPQPFLNEVAIIFVGADAQSAVAHAALGLYSPTAAKYDLDTTGDTVRLRPPASDVLSADPFSVRFDDHLRIAGLPVRAADVRALYGEAALPAGSYPQARARLTPAGLELQVHNPTGQRLADCFFKYNRLVIPLGDIAAGATQTLSNLTASSALQFSARVVASSEDELRTRIRRVLFPDPVYSLDRQRTGELLSRHLRGALADWAPAVYGWTDRPVFPLQADSGLARRAAGLWAIESPLTCAGTHLTLPRGMVRLRLKNTDARSMERAEGRFSSTRGGKILVEFTLPAECPNLRVEEANVIVDFQGSAFQCAVQLRPPGSGEIPSRQPALTGGPVYPIAAPGLWYDPVRRSFTVAIDVTAGHPEQLDQLAVNYWQIRELDLELGGTVP